MSSTATIWIFPSDVIAFFYISIASLIGAAAFIFFLFSSRIVKNNLLYKEAKLRDRFQKSVNVILQMDSSQDEPEASHQFYFSQLINDMGGSNLAKQVMIDQLMGLRKSLVGSSATSLTNVYAKLQLGEFSLHKLDSLHWTTRAQGVYELSQMAVDSSISKIRTLLQSKNTTIREEALIALVRLDNNKSLDFLDNYTSPLSSWMVMRIHQQLSLSDKRLLPDFSRWYKHDNIDISLFAIEMTRQFRQINNAPKLIALLNTEPKVVALVIDVCGDLQSHEVADPLVNIIEKYWSEELISRNLTRSLGKVAHNELHWSKIAGYLNHPSYIVRFESAKALYNADGKAKQLLNSAHLVSQSELNAIVRHVEEPLLQL